MDRPKELVNSLGDSSVRFFYLGNCTIVQIESASVAKVLQSEKNAVEILDTMDIETPKKCKNPNRNARNGRIGSIGR
jgi:hypothetical protein